jgi:hypothetical protein
VTSQEFLELAATTGYQTAYGDPVSVDAIIQEGLAALQDPEVLELFNLLHGTP